MALSASELKPFLVLSVPFSGKGWNLALDGFELVSLALSCLGQSDSNWVHWPLKCTADVRHLILVQF